MVRAFTAALFFLAVAAFLPLQAQSVAIIVHPETEIVSLTKAELSQIFLKRVAHWDDRRDAFPVDQVPSSPVRREFTRWIHNRRDVVIIEVYWKRMIFSGRGVPPPEMADDDAVIAYVRSTPGAVGYVAKSARTEGVRVLKVVD